MSYIKKETKNDKVIDENVKLGDSTCIQEFWLVNLYTYFFTTIFCIVFHIGFYFKAKRIISIRHFLWVYVFLFYLSLVYGVTQIATVWDISRYETWIRVSQINLTLFDTAGSTAYLLNIVLFMPLGFLLPTIWSQFRKMKNTVCAGFFFHWQLS